MGHAAPTDGPGPDRVALGQALAARADEIGTQVASRFPEFLRTEAFASSRLGTALIGRWLATDEVASAEEELTLSRQGQQVVLMEVDLGMAVKGYLHWRDLCSAVLWEEGARLGSGQDLVEMACAVVRLSCDGGLVRTVRAFDETRSVLQERLRKEQANLSHQALHDELTGLPNRTLLADRLRRAALGATRSGQRPMLLFLDLDNFKAINDRFGHSAGDSLLVAVAERLLALVRSSDTVARLGGDEFVILAEDLEDPTVAAQSLAERIHQTMRAPVPVGDRELHSSVSIGITQVPPEADPDICLAQADAAMYQAKRSGPAHFEMYNTSIGAEYRREGQLADELRVAHGRGELGLHYQPLFRIAGGRAGGLVGAEALLRWAHPELGSVPPSEFVPMLERSRQIIPVGRWVLEEATFQCHEWQARGRGLSDMTMSVNVSARQLQDPDFYDDVQDALDGSGLDPSHLVLEVTETDLVVDIAQIGTTMQRVRDLGVHLALDDFGTGYSSLLYLQGMPIDRLKIDRSFVASLGEVGHDGTIIQTVIDLAHTLGIIVVAEGVETEDELQAVGAMGCDEVQGFLLGRPQPPHLLSLTGAEPVSSHS
ncbi:MAG: EAL domain-containing protein [Acidimicrobiales bacterium]